MSETRWRLVQDDGRCPICDWPLAESADKGCVPGNCSYRPEGRRERARIEARRQILAAAPDPSRDAALQQRIAAAIANARGNRRGMPAVTNVLDMLPAKLRDEVMDDARAVLAALTEPQP